MPLVSKQTVVLPNRILLTGDEPRSMTGDTVTSPRQLCRLLEAGGVIYFDHSPMALPEPDRVFLLEQKQLASGYHKNIAYKPHLDRLTGVQMATAEDTDRLKRILHDYASRAQVVVEKTLAPYREHLTMDFTSFRPVEEQGRRLRTRARNDLLHVDSFPTRPTLGKRILRVFTNIHPTKVRVWQTSRTFDALVREFQHQVPPYDPQAVPRSIYPRTMKALARLFGFKTLERPAYDRWMLRFHHFLKENTAFQQTCPKATWEFPPGSGWMVYTDMVSHAVLSGQSALEQTFLVDPQAMVTPEKTPIRILETCYGKRPRG